MHDLPVKALLESAARDPEPAWREIHRRYTPLVTATCRHYGVFGADSDDVCGTVWLRLLTRMGTIRTAEALPGWLATTARHECLRLLRDRRRQIPGDAGTAECTGPEVEATLLGEERRAALRHALAGLSARDQELLSMLFSDPPVPYAAISSALAIPIGSIGPTRQRCLARLRGSAAIIALRGEQDHRLRPGGPLGPARRTSSSTCRSA